jgi:DNA-binding PadR family transcriptional regulator
MYRTKQHPGTFELLILMTLPRDRGKKTAEILAEFKAKKIYARSGSISTALTRLEEKKLVFSLVETPAAPRRGGRPNQIYRITDQGAASLQEMLRLMDQMRPAI